MAAVLAGARSFTAIGEWAGDASEAVLATLGVRRNRRTGRVVAPDEATLRRAAQRIDPDVLDDTLAAWVASRHDARPRAVALDGKTVRGARDHADPTSRAPHLMAAVDHADATVVSQRQVDDKSNEITAAKPLLEPLDLEGVVVTADAIHTQRDLAEWLVATKLAHYLLIVLCRGRDYADTAACRSRTGLRRWAPGVWCHDRGRHNHRLSRKARSASPAR
jgi:hypothetical protein